MNTFFKLTTLYKCFFSCILLLFVLVLVVGNILCYYRKKVECEIPSFMFATLNFDIVWWWVSVLRLRTFQCQ